MAVTGVDFNANALALAAHRADEHGVAVRTRRLLEEVRVDFATSRVEADWLFLDGDATRAAHSSLRLYCIRELCDLLRRADFRDTAALDARTGKPFTVGSRRLGLVAQL
jgi:hypothetical protein